MINRNSHLTKFEGILILILVGICIACNMTVFGLAIYLSVKFVIELYKTDSFRAALSWILDTKALIVQVACLIGTVVSFKIAQAISEE